MANVVDLSNSPDLLELARHAQQDQWHRHNTESMLSLDTSVFGFPLRVVTNHSPVHTACNIALRRFTTSSIRDGERPILLRLFAREMSCAPSNTALDDDMDGRVGFQYDGCDDWAAIDFGDHGHIAIDLNNRSAVGFLSQPLANSTEIVARFIISTTLLNILARCALIQWHAASLVKAAKAVMLIGTDNSGKSTTAAALLRAGYSILGESLTYTRQTGDGIELMGFPVGHLRLRSEGISFFSDWMECSLRTPGDDGDKWLLNLEAIVPDRVLRSSQTFASIAMMFVSVGGGEDTEARAISEDEAIQSALPACGLWEGKRETERVLGDVRLMIRRMPCYRLLVGRNLDKVVAVVNHVMEEL